MIRDEETLRTIKWLYQKSKNKGFMLGILIIENVLFGTSSVLFALCSQGVIDSATKQDRQKLIFFLGALVGVIFFHLILRLMSRYLEAAIKTQLECVLKQDLLKEIQEKDFMEINKYHSGDLLTRMFSDITIISSGITSIVPNVIAMATKLIFAFSILFVLDWRFAISFTLASSLIFFVSRTFRRIIKNLHKDSQEMDGKLRSFLQETVENLLIVKVFSIESKMLQKLSGIQQDYYHAVMKQKTASALMNSGFYFFIQVGYFSSLVYGAIGLYLGTMTFGTLTAILQLISQVQQPFTNFSGISSSLYGVIASAERVMEIENIKAELHNGDAIDVKKIYNSLHDIVIENITYTNDRDTVLEHTSFTIKKGDFVAVTGISGIGKSTLLKLILGVMTPQQGQLYLRSNSMKSNPLDKIQLDSGTRKLFSYVPQENYILSGTIRENIMLINEEATDEEVAEAINISCAKSFISKMPQGLDTMIGERGKGLSEGQVQRVAIARAILSGAPILLFDEATSALDETTELQLLKNLKCLKDITLVIVSHKKAALDICNNEIVIENKKIVRKGNNICMAL